MVNWWNSLDFFMQVLYCIAIPSTLLLVLQTILLVFGFGDGSEGVDFTDTSALDVGEISDSIDFNGDGTPSADISSMQLFTIQGFVALLTVFGWTSIVCYKVGLHPVLSILIGLALGLGAMVGIAKLISASAKLASDGTLNYKNAIGSTGTVYLTLLANGKFGGKVTVTVQEKQITADALNLSDTDISVGSMVKIVGTNDEVLICEKA